MASEDRSSFFDDDDLKISFTFVKSSKVQHRDLLAPPSLRTTFVRTGQHSDSVEAPFGLHNRFIVQYHGDSYKAQEYVLDIAHSRLKIHAPGEHGFPHGFSVTRNGVTYAFGCTSEHVMNDWTNSLKAYCVLPNFHDKYKALKMIGKGSFAKVYLVECKANGKSYAVKSFTKDGLIASNKNNAKPSMINEIDIMRIVDHDNTIKLYEVYETEKSIYLILDLIQGKSLQDTLRKSSFKSESSEIRIYNMIRAILDALAYLANKNIMHRDLKPENILLDKNDKIKIVDFGLATFIDINEYIFKKCGTPGYIAPEVFKFDQKILETRYNDRCDVFSAGCIFFFMLFGYPFFDGLDASEILTKNRRVGNDFEILAKIKQEISNPKSKINKEALDLLQQLVEMDPKKRISAAEALNHPYFTPTPIGMYKPVANGSFFTEPITKIQTGPGSPTRSPVRDSWSHSPDRVISSIVSASPDKQQSPRPGGKRYTEKDSLYLDMGRPEMNGKVDTLNNGSTNNSMLLMNRNDSHGNLGSPNSVSAFGKNEGRGRSNSKNYRASQFVAPNQSVLKAAIFRNMQMNHEMAADSVNNLRRGSIENHLQQSPTSERKQSAFFKGNNAEDSFEQGKSNMNEHDPNEDHSATMRPKRFQPFANKH